MSVRPGEAHAKAGASTRTGLKSLSSEPAIFTPQILSRSNWIKRFRLWMRRRSILPRAFPQRSISLRESGDQIACLCGSARLHPNILILIWGSVQEANIFDELRLETGAICVLERVYLNFARLGCLTLVGAFFVISYKLNLSFYVVFRLTIDPTKDLRCDQTFLFRGFYHKQRFPCPCVASAITTRSILASSFSKSISLASPPFSCTGITASVSISYFFSSGSGKSQNTLFPRHHLECCY